MTSKDRNRNIRPYIKRVFKLFFVLNFLDFKLMPIDSALNSGTGRLNSFFQILGCGNRDIRQTPKIRLKLVGDETKVLLL